MAATALLRLSIVAAIVTIVRTQIVTTEDTSDEDEIVSGGYILPKQIFNEGKPFYLDKDPVSGQFDFSSKKPAGIEPEANEVLDPKEKIILNNSSPNIHDFLNLPVKYSSSKFVYPLVSSSYANLKYQGNNKNFISNHKNHTSIVSPPPKYFSSSKANVTRLHPSNFPHSTTDQPVRYVTDRTTTSTTVIKNKYAPTKKYATTTIAGINLKPTNRPTLSPYSKPTTTTRRTNVPQFSTTTRPYRPTLTTTSRVTTTSTPKLPITTTTATTTTTYSPTTSFRPPSTTGYSTLPTTLLFSTRTTPTSPTTTFTYPITTTDIPPYRPQVPLTTLPNLDAAEVYNSVGQKKDPNTMSLEDIFNVFGEETFDALYDNNETFHTPSSQFLDLPASPPAPFAMHTTQKQQFLDSVQPTELIPQVNPMQDTNNYVHYKVQQPNTNVVNYHLPSMNNILISPDQNSTSFVIGSQQSVGSSIIVGTGEKPPTLFENGQQIHYGTVINEQLNPMHGQNSQTNAQQGPPHQMFMGQPPALQQNLFFGQGQSSIQQAPLIQTLQQQTEQSYHSLPLDKPSNEMQDTQELLVQSNIRFPSETVINGHGSPTSFNPQSSGNNQESSLPANPVVFPKNELQEQATYNQVKVGGSQIVFQQNEGTTDKGEILTLNQQKLFEKKYPRLPENLTPPNPAESHKWPSNPNRHHTSTPSNKYNEFTRKPLPGLRRPNPDRPLPNILPQFRPNAKISHGHPNFNREPGNIRVPHNNGPFLNRPKGPAPPFAHRRTPVLNRPNFKGGPDPMNNRRVYKVPPPFPHNMNRLYLQRQQRPPQGLPFNQLRPNNDGFLGERHAVQTELLSQTDSIRPERLPAFEEEDFVINDPPRPVVKKGMDMPNLEPVVTLQMLKSKKRMPQPTFLSPYSPAPAPVEPKPSAVPSFQGAGSEQSPVYVVYPMKSNAGQFNELDAFGNEAGGPLVLGQNEDKSSMPGSEVNKLPQTYEYENTPFSVVRDQPEAPILMVKNKSQPQDNRDFPYPLEKPDPAFAEFSKQQGLSNFERNYSVDLTPRVVNRGDPSAQALHADSPIAIAYTPTEASNYYKNHKNDNKFSRPNLASQVIPEIQTEESINEELDTRGQHFEKDFMAPFYPSVSLSEASNSQQGWSVFAAAATNHSMHDKNNINRVDLNDDGSSDPEKRFDPDQFSPELQGGFKPIYPPDYRSRQNDESNSNKEPQGKVDEPTSTSPAHEATSTTTTTTTTQMTPTEAVEVEATTKRVKSTIEASLESLLFGDDEDYDLDKEQESRSA